MRSPSLYSEDNLLYFLGGSTIDYTLNSGFYKEFFNFFKKIDNQ